MTQISAPVSVGELLDKMAILQIKSERISDEAKLANVCRELEVLGATWVASGLDRPELEPLKHIDPAGPQPGGDERVELIRHQMLGNRVPRARFDAC